MRPLLVLMTLLAPTLAGCTQDPAPAPEKAEILLYALDGRWPFDAARAGDTLARAELPAPEGELVMGEAMADRTLADFLAVDATAAATLGLAELEAGEAVATRAWAHRENVDAGANLTLRSHAWPDPYVATYFEMERILQCEKRPEAKLCFLPVLREGEARLRLRVDPGARDAGFLPDLVELGPNARPAWWNGSFDGPDGSTEAFSAYALLDGTLQLAEKNGTMAAGEWIIRFRLETRHGLAPAGAAGIVRVREPGYLWFDDRLQQREDPLDQARGVLENATPTRADVTIGRLVDALPFGADLLISTTDARVLVGTTGVTGLLVNLTPTQRKTLEQAGGPDGMTLALRARPIEEAGGAGEPDEGDIILAAPADLDIRALPHVEGAGAPVLALSGRPGIAERAILDADPVGPDLLLLAPADGSLPWTLPAGARWMETRDAIENLSRSRTLALASTDLLLAPIATARVELGEGNTTRSLVAIGGVVGGPNETLWTSAALVAGAGRPATPRLIVPVADGAERDDVAARAIEAWRAHGVVLDR